MVSKTSLASEISCAPFHSCFGSSFPCDELRPAGGNMTGTKAESSIVVPDNKSEHGIVLVRPQENLDPGEYAVKFGATNEVIFDFAVEAAK
jgi:hypothetical protein